MDEIVVKILVELFSTLGVVTEELKQRRSSKSLPPTFNFCSAQRSQVRKEVFEGEGYRGSVGEAGPAHAR
jgi:hypothetical protein